MDDLLRRMVKAPHIARLMHGRGRDARVKRKPPSWVGAGADGVGYPQLRVYPLPVPERRRDSLGRVWTMVDPDRTRVLLACDYESISGECRWEPFLLTRHSIHAVWRQLEEYTGFWLGTDVGDERRHIHHIYVTGIRFAEATT